MSDNEIVEKPLSQKIGNINIYTYYLKENGVPYNCGPAYEGILIKDADGSIKCCSIADDDFSIEVIIEIEEKYLSKNIHIESKKL